MDDNTDWLVELTSKVTSAVNGAMNVDIGGVKVNLELGLALLRFLQINKNFLIKLGKESFVDFLYLLHEKKEEEAFLLISSKMDADDIIAQMNGDAEILKQNNDDYDQFISDVISFGKTVVLPIVVKALLGLLVAAVI